MPRGIGLPPRRLYDQPMIQNAERGGTIQSGFLKLFLSVSSVFSVANFLNRQTAQRSVPVIRTNGRDDRSPWFFS
jgi:hypothetical protein